MFIKINLIMHRYFKTLENILILYEIVSKSNFKNTILTILFYNFI